MPFFVRCLRPATGTIKTASPLFIGIFETLGIINLFHNTLHLLMLEKNTYPLKNIDNIHQFEALFNFATIGIVVTNNEGKIVNFNKYAETQFRYTRQEILGHTVDKLLPTSAHARHVKYREEYYDHPEPRIMGHGRDLFAQRKNGETFPVEV